VQAREYSDKRTSVKNNQYNQALQETDTQKSNAGIAQVKIEDLADMVKEKYNIDVKTSTNDVMKSFTEEVKQRQLDPKLVTDYMN
jgi:hypothetical protein